jgi:hypothetical protein
MGKEQLHTDQDLRERCDIILRKSIIRRFDRSAID